MILVLQVTFLEMADELSTQYAGLFRSEDWHMDIFCPYRKFDKTDFSTGYSSSQPRSADYAARRDAHLECSVFTPDVKLEQYYLNIRNCDSI